METAVQDSEFGSDPTSVIDESLDEVLESTQWNAPSQPAIKSATSIVIRKTLSNTDVHPARHGSCGHTISGCNLHRVTIDSKIIEQTLTANTEIGSKSSQPFKSKQSSSIRDIHQLPSLRPSQVHPAGYQCQQAVDFFLSQFRSSPMVMEPASAIASKPIGKKF